MLFSQKRLLLGLFPFVGAVFASAATWSSPATGSSLEIRWLEPIVTAKPAAPLPVVFYLENLATTRVGTEGDDTIIADFRAAGYLVAAIDYAHDPHARVPSINRDFIALRSQLQKKVLLADRAIDLLHVFIIPAGCRLKRDVVFYRDTDRTLAMDIIYPSQPARSVGAVLEFSCDNANRMSNFSLDFCTDTLLPAAACEGFAAAMADHPVAAPYKGFDAMPECAWKIKAAVRALRAESHALALNGRVVPAGFSRGSGMALMLATTMDHPEFDRHGEHTEGDSSVQGAVVLSGRFTYLDLLPDDKMIPRYEKAWGPRTSHPEVWRAQGALDYLDRALPVPLFLSISVSESPDALHQMETLRHRLTELHSAFLYAPEPEPRGHRVPINPAVLSSLFDYLHRQLDAVPRSNATSSLPP